MKVAIYLRVSTDQQGQDGSSLDSQREDCLNKASELNLKADDDFIVSESYTGAELDRPGLDKVRQWARDKEISHIICYDPDRLARDFVYLMVLVNEFEKANVELIFVTQPARKTPEEKMLFGMKGLFAEFERTKILDRTHRGRLARVREGKLLGGGSSKLYGYHYSNGKRSINDAQTKIVKAIFKWFVEDTLSVGSIVSRLASMRIPSSSGNPYWNKPQLVKMLHNRAYTGETNIQFKFDKKKVTLPDATPPIISREVFNRAQEQLTENKENALRNCKNDYLLRQHVFCQHCGRRYTGAIRRTRKKTGVKETLNYRCGRQFDSNPFARCRNRIWNARNLETLVWEKVEGVLSSPETVLRGIKAIEEQGGKTSVFELELQKVEVRLRELDKEQEALLGNAQRGFPEKLIIAENEKINGQRDELLQWKSKLGNSIQVSGQANIDIEGIKQACELVSKNLTELSFENKRLALKALSIKVWIDRDDIRLEGIIPIPEDAIVTTQSLSRLSHAHLPCL